MLKKTRALYLLLAIVIASSLMFISCAEDSADPSGNNNNDPTDNVSCKIDGESWEAYGLFTNIVGGGTSESISFAASDSDDDLLSFVMGIPKIGDNPLGGSNTNLGSFLFGEKLHLIDEGNINITTMSDTRLIGTFEFTAKYFDYENPTEIVTITITEGEFDVPFYTNAVLK
ncbi:MAG: hypothetical protein KAH48_06225 [Chlorobi bacterium]|nr:hypothetical protein [Chlorobiota bacterium]